MAVRFVTGDLFLSKAQTLAHGVNTRDKMGRGIAVEFKLRFPGMYEEYRRRCRTGELLPGGVYLEKSQIPWVLNLASQATMGGAELKDVQSCFEWISANYASEGIVGIAMPRIAAGLGGLPWGEVKDLIVQILRPLPIPVYVYEQFISGIKTAEEVPTLGV
jgi:O-acetyl-ADP-ribose deacetylase (regulator of RNase III)